MNFKFLHNSFTQFKELPHTAIGLIVFGITMTFHWLTGRDLGPNMTMSISAMYMFLLGHGGMSLWAGTKNGGNGGGGDQTAAPPAAPDPNAAAAPAAAPTAAASSAP